MLIIPLNLRTLNSIIWTKELRIRNDIIAFFSVTNETMMIVASGKSFTVSDSVPKKLIMNTLARAAIERDRAMEDGLEDAGSELVPLNPADASRYSHPPENSPYWESLVSVSIKWRACKHCQVVWLLGHRRLWKNSHEISWWPYLIGASSRVIHAGTLGRASASPAPQRQKVTFEEGGEMASTLARNSPR